LTYKEVGRYKQTCHLAVFPGRVTFASLKPNLYDTDNHHL